MKQNMVTMSRAESMVSRKVEAQMEALLAKMQVVASHTHIIPHA